MNSENMRGKAEGSGMLRSSSFHQRNGTTNHSYKACEDKDLERPAS
jgi:hypothetical protein